MSWFCRHKWVLFESIRKVPFEGPMHWLHTWYCEKCGDVRMVRDK